MSTHTKKEGEMQALCVLAGWVSMVAFVAWVYAGSVASTIISRFPF